MRSLSRIYIAVAITFAAFALPAKAAPLSNHATPVKGESSLIQKAHYWHRDCEWGPFRYHRHIPGVGNVPCHRGHYWHRRHWDRDDDDHEYRDHHRHKRHWNDDYSDDDDDDYR